MPAPTIRKSHSRTVRSGREIDELAHGRAGLQSCEALVDLREPDAAGDQVIELELTLSIEGEQPRHVDPEAVAAHRGALDLTVAQKVETVELDLHAVRHHTDDRGGAAGAQHCKGLLGGGFGA